MRNFKCLSSIFLAASTLSFGSHRATASLTGSGYIELNNYPAVDESGPPGFCGIPWTELNLNLITAVESLDSSDCAAVCGDYGCEHVMAVDQGGNGLALSTGCSAYVIGATAVAAVVYANWTQVAGPNCYGIWITQLCYNGVC